MAASLLSSTRIPFTRAVPRLCLTRSLHSTPCALLRTSPTASPFSSGSPSSSNADQLSSSPTSANAPPRGGRARAKGDADEGRELSVEGRDRDRKGSGALLPFNQFPSLSSLLPSPLRSLFGRSERGRDLFDIFRGDPFFATLSPLSPALPTTAGVAAALPALLPLVGGVSRGVWDIDAELVNPVQGMEVEETDDAYVVRTRLSPAIPRRDVHLKLETTPDGQPVLHMWGELKKRERDRRLRGEKHVYSSFQRFIILPEDVDPATVEARFDEDNTLRIIMHKKEEAKRQEGKREIDIGNKGPEEAEDRPGQRAGESPEHAAPLGGGLPGARVVQPSAQAGM